MNTKTILIEVTVEECGSGSLVEMFNAAMEKASNEVVFINIKEIYPRWNKSETTLTLTIVYV